MYGFNVVYIVLEMVYHNIYNRLILEPSLKPKTFIESLKIIYHNPNKKLTLDYILNYKTFKTFIHVDEGWFTTSNTNLHS